MKRRLLIFAVFLVLGMVVNVAVAWGCVVWSDDRSVWVAVVNALSGRRMPRSPDPADAAWLDAEGFVAKEGWTLILEYLDAPGVRRLVVCQDTPENYDGVLPMDPDVVRTDAGWPVKSLTGSQWRDVWSGGPIVHRQCIGVLVRAFDPINSVAVEERALPLRPLWTGFGIDTVFYAMTLWLIVRGPFALRRRLRIRRGQCAGCGYAVGASPVCTECGRELPPAIRPRTC